MSKNEMKASDITIWLGVIVMLLIALFYTFFGFSADEIMFSQFIIFIVATFVSIVQMKKEYKMWIISGEIKWDVFIVQNRQ